MSLKPDKPESMIRDKLMENKHVGKYKNKADDVKNGALAPPTSWTKHPIPLLLGILGTWLLLGSYAYRLCFCMSPGEAFPLLITDGTTVVSSAEENLRFSKGDATPYISDNKIKTELEKAAKYVSESDDKMLIITGKYNENELAEGDSSNLGLTRALNLRTLFAEWGLDSNRTIARGESSITIIPIKDTIYGGAGFEIQEIPNRYMKFTGGNLNIKADDNISFDFSSAKINQPIPDGVKAKAKELVDYLKANPEQKLQIVGLYGTQENAGTDDLNLGRARAEALRKWWLSMGIPAGQVEITGAEERNNLVFINGKLYGGAEYKIDGLPAEGANTADSTNSDGNEVAGNDKNGNNTDDASKNGNDGSDAGAVDIPPIVNIYFDKNSDLPNLSANEGEKLASFVTYLNKYKNKGLTIKGYASEEGNAAFNKRLGSLRGEAVKTYLVGKGVAENQITIIAMGATETTAKDGSEAERSKDRRAELRIPK